MTYSSETGVASPRRLTMICTVPVDETVTAYCVKGLATGPELTHRPKPPLFVTPSVVAAPPDAGPASTSVPSVAHTATRFGVTVPLWVVVFPVLISNGRTHSPRDPAWYTPRTYAAARQTS